MMMLLLWRTTAVGDSRGDKTCDDIQLLWMEDPTLPYCGLLAMAGNFGLFRKEKRTGCYNQSLVICFRAFGVVIGRRRHC